jgi:cytidine deaminase
MFQAVANGAKEFHRMVICADTTEPIAPCGACRQVMVELAPQMEVLLINQEGKQIFTTVEKLMPYSFSDFPQQTENDEGDV